MLWKLVGMDEESKFESETQVNEGQSELGKSNEEGNISSSASNFQKQELVNETPTTGGASESYAYGESQTAEYAYPSYEDIEYELGQYKEYADQLNNAIEQRDRQINHQQHQMKTLKVENRKLKTKVEKFERILKAKERSFKREKTELQRENNNLAKQLKILEMEVLNFMRAQGIEEGESFSEDEDEDDYYNNNMQGSTDAEESDDPAKTFETCVICGKAVGFCVHTKQSANYAPPATFRPTDNRQETTSHDYSNPTEDGLTHFSGHRNSSEIQPDAPPEENSSEIFEDGTRKVINQPNDKMRSLDTPDGSLGKQAELKRTNRVAAWEQNSVRDVNTHGSSDKNVDLETSSSSAIENMNDKVKQMSFEHAPSNASDPKTGTVEEIFTKAFAEESNNQKISKPLGAEQEEPKEIRQQKKTIPPPQLESASSQAKPILRGRGKRIGKSTAKSSRRGKKYLIKSEQNKSLSDLKAPTAVVNRLPQHLRRVIRSKNRKNMSVI